MDCREARAVVSGTLQRAVSRVSGDNIISPFRGIRYQAAESRDLSTRIAPPYDVISESLSAELRAGDPHNFVRVELPEAHEADTEEANRYTRAAATLQDWLSRGVLIRDEGASFYILEQEFSLEGRSWRRRGVFALVRLPEKGERYVLSHEGTLAAPKADRLRLLQTCQMATSPILMIAEDSGQQLAGLLGRTHGEPAATAQDSDGVMHRLWARQEADYLGAIREAVGPGPLFIADGHHRFETAVTCRDGMRRMLPQAAPEAAFSYALALIASAGDEALRILPTHRLIRGLGKVGVARMKEAMRARFEVEERPLADAGEVQLSSPEPGRHVLGAYCGDARYYVLRAGEELTPAGASAVASLDVSVLHDHLIDPVLATLDRQPKLTYVTDDSQAMAAVDRGECDFAFFLRPTRVSEVLAVARAGDRMPGKSTYFYPKAPAGLVISDASAEPI